MLVLGRKVGQKVVVGEGDSQVTVQVVDIKGYGPNATIRLGFDCPKEIPIGRIEIGDDGVPYRVGKKATP